MKNTNPEDFARTRTFYGNNKGLRDQMKEAKVEDYNNFKMEDLVAFTESLIKDSPRTFVLGTGKMGVIQYYEQLGVSEETLAYLKENLPEGYYEITELGAKRIDYE